MRKQVQKERCTKIKLEKCPRVCCLYDKVQLATARMLNADPSVVQIECNIPLSLDEIPADDLNLPSETYTTDFVIHFSDGKIAVREAVFRSHLSRPSVAERLELSRRYWQQQGIDDWGIIIDKGVTIHILNMGVIDNSPMGRLMVTMLLAFAEFERALIIERTQTGKAAARSRTGFRDGRPPKFTPEQIDHAIGLLETHSYKQVTKMTGISRSTLQRENRKRREQ